MDNQRNLILMVVITMGFLLLYQMFIINPEQERIRAAQMAEREAQATAEQTTTGAVTGNNLSEPAETTLEQGGAGLTLADAPRIPIRSDALQGSISLYGGRFDDLTLLRYDTTLRTRENPDPAPVTLLRPDAGQGGYNAVFGWLPGAEETIRDVPGPRTVWSAEEGAVLTPQSPVTLTYQSGDGLTFRRTISMDDDYLFTITDRVENTAGQDVTISPYGRTRRIGTPEDLFNFFILHEGPIGVLDDKLVQRKYKKILDDGGVERRSPVGGWIGVTDKYWLTAMVPPSEQAFEGSFRVTRGDNLPRFDTIARQDPLLVPAGGAIENKTLFFAGAKRSELISAYETEYGINKLNLSIDWGNFWFLTKPMFMVLEFFYGLFGNFGVAILALTVVVKAIFFPLANASYKSMAKMKAINPKIQELRTRFKADPQRMQKEQMALFQREGVNPVAGCLPLLIQMPVFYALYKTLFVTIEMRHQPFVGYIRDLSAKDPTNMWNLFGLLPYDPNGWPILGGILAIGILPIIMGISMAAMQTLNPPPPDKMQARIFMALPFVLTIIMAPFAAGLVLYWTWNNILSFIQQYIIVRRQGVDTPIGTWMARHYRRLTGAGAANDAGLLAARSAKADEVEADEAAKPDSDEATVDTAEEVTAKAPAPANDPVDDDTPSPAADAADTPPAKPATNRTRSKKRGPTRRKPTGKSTPRRPDPAPGKS